MSIENERKVLLKRIHREGKGNLKVLAKKVRIPYSTFLELSNGLSSGTMKSWIKIEKYFAKQDKQGQQVDNPCPVPSPQENDLSCT